MSRTLNAIALATVGVGSLAILGAAVAGAPPDVSGWKIYRNRTIGIEFRHPADAVPNELAAPDGRAIIIRLEGRDWSASVRVEELTAPPEDTATILRRAIGLAQRQCAADGPDSSVSCPTVLAMAPFTTTLGRSGLELYLAEETILNGGEGQPDTTETRTKGPIYALDISTASPARVLLVTATDRAASREHLEILRGIVDSVWVPNIP